ncbi:hypothetical protein EDD66_104204 [Mobilisporobacter senegalensis]|uniref:Lipoprotein n=1 Tax=Mobilisporobacter senegalensis TaxID=1329262 RepID=A0A3N1XUQ0_9FIRM|nr:hypothetical protein [Mobilisporobacter senegalensis]ROR28617.1 hypothetical protein EDD66_104204 [Mobilisporobacter senegalensis]
MNRKLFEIIMGIIIAVLLSGCSNRDKTGYYPINNINSKLSHSSSGLTCSNEKDDYYYSNGIIYKYGNSIESSEPIVDTIKVSGVEKLYPTNIAVTNNYLYFIIDGKFFQTDLHTKETEALFPELTGRFVDVAADKEGIFISYFTNISRIYWMDDGKKEWDKVIDLQKMLLDGKKTQNIYDFNNYVTLFKNYLILGDDHLGIDDIRVTSVFSQTKDNILMKNNGSAKEYFMLDGIIYGLKLDGYYLIDNSTIYPISALADYDSVHFNWIPGHYVVENKKLYILVQYAKPPKVVNPHQSDSIFDAIIEVDPIVGDSKVLFKTKSNMPRIVAYEEGFVYLFREYQISSYNLATGEEKKLADLPEKDSLIFDCVNGKIFVYEWETAYHRLMEVVELRD